MTSTGHPFHSPVFATTHWTRVLQARGSSVEAKSALSELCAAYYDPVFACIRRSTSDDDSARDLTQEFFAQLLARQGVDTVDPQRGRFRSYLLGAIRHFLADQFDHSRRLKRGSGQPLQPIHDVIESPGGFEPSDATRRPDREFDRKWALTVLAHALGTLEQEHAETGKADHFEALKPWLTGESEGVSQATAAAQLGINEGAVKVAIHRLRRRFRDLVKAEIRQTLLDPAQAADELSSLLAAFRKTE